MSRNLYFWIDKVSEDQKNHLIMEEEKTANTKENRVIPNILTARGDNISLGGRTIPNLPMAKEDNVSAIKSIKAESGQPSKEEKK